MFSSSNGTRRAVQIFLLVLIVIGLGLLFTQKLWVPNLVEYILQHEESETLPTMPEEPGEVEVEPSPTGALTLGEVRQYGSVSIRPLAVEEDSRCPVDVTCIQAGTVRLLVEVVSNGGVANSHILELEEPQIVDNVSITLTNVYPENNTQRPLNEAEYGFVFSVTQEAAPVAESPTNGCYVGGCSSQLCTDNPDIASTCEYREEYACYRTAECKRQASGQCGWTETAELRMCLNNTGTPLLQM